MSTNRIKILKILLIVMFNSFFSNGMAQKPKELTYQIVATFTPPGPSISALTIADNYLWIADDSISTIYKVDPKNGIILLSFPSPGPQPTGLTWDGNNLLILEDKTKKIYKIKISERNIGFVISSIDAPTIKNDTKPSLVTGLTWDGGYLWSSNFDGWSSKVNQVDTTNGTIKRWFYGCGTSLAFDGNYLWVVDSQEGHYKGFVDKRDFSGKWLAYFRTPGYYPTGLAFDGNYFWLADNGNDLIYKIKVNR